MGLGLLQMSGAGLISRGSRSVGLGVDHGSTLKIIGRVNCGLRQAPSENFDNASRKIAIRITTHLIQFKLNKSHASKTIRSLRGMLRIATYCQGNRLIEQKTNFLH